MANLDLTRLKELPAEARDRVEEALRATLESELASGVGRLGGGSSPAAAFSRSKGFFFSRSRTSDVLRESPYEIDQTIVRNITTLDDKSFAKMADRLATLKKLGGGD